MQAQLITKEGTAITLDDAQYERILSLLGILTPADAEAALVDLEALIPDWGFSLDEAS